MKQRWLTRSARRPSQRVPGVAAVALAAALLMAGCGGGSPDEPEQAFAAAMAQARQAADETPVGAKARLLAQAPAATDLPPPALPVLPQPLKPEPITADDWFGWIEQTYPAMFPTGPQTQSVQYNQRSFRIRHYPQQNVYLGVTDDGHVHALGPFTENTVQQYGQLVNYRCVVRPSSCRGEESLAISIWNWAGTRQCLPSDFLQRQDALRRELLASGLSASGGQCAWTLENAMPAVCGAPDGRMAVFTIPKAEFPQALASGWRPFLSDVNGSLNHPVMTPCETWSGAR